MIAEDGGETNGSDKAEHVRFKMNPLSETHPHLNGFMSLLGELKKSPRGEVLISCSFLDEILKNILLSFLLEGKQAKDLISGFNAPLGT